MRQRGFIFPIPMLWVAIGAAAIIALLSGALWLQTSRLNATRAEYSAFVATVKSAGEAAEKRAQETIARDQRNKDTIDAQTKKLRAADAALATSLLVARTSRSYLSAPAPGAREPDAACFSRAELESAIGRLDAGISGLIAKGDAYRIDLDAARDWAQAR